MTGISARNCTNAVHTHHPRLGGCVHLCTLALVQMGIWACANGNVEAEANPPAINPQQIVGER